MRFTLEGGAIAWPSTKTTGRADYLAANLLPETRTTPASPVMNTVGPAPRVRFCFRDGTATEASPDPDLAARIDYVAANLWPGSEP